MGSTTFLLCFSIAWFSVRFLPRAAAQPELPPLGRYEIGENRIDFQGTTVAMMYPLSDLVPNGTVSVTTYSDTDCTVDISDNQFLVPEVIYDSVPSPDGTKNREVTIFYTVDPIEIQKSDVWVQRSNDQFFMNFCVGLHLNSGDGPASVRIASLDTVVLLQVDLLGDFGTDVAVIPDDQLEEQANQIYYAEGFLCDKDNKRVEYNVPLTQGSLVRICVKPRDDALDDGVYMRRVESFTFRREDPTGGTITQRAVIDGRSANQALTQLECIPGSELCYFDTLLNADFYFGAGTVTGVGDAWLQFGRGSSSTTRRLQIETSGRVLQVNGGFAGSSYIETNFFVLQSDDTDVFTAHAYECNQWGQALNRSTPKLLGEGIRVCVTPDELSQEFGITINRIESWNFTKASTVQAAIEGGEAGQDGLTMLTCVPGSSLCIFRTQFTQDFFGNSGVVNGFGNVVLQYASGALSSRRLTSIPPTVSGRRGLQEDVFDIAGESPVSVNTTVLFKEEVLPERCRYEHKVSEWWIQQTMEDRYKYIGILVGTTAAIASLLCCCWLFPCLSERRDEEEVEIKEKGGGVEVNVDLKNEKNQHNTSTVKKTEHDYKNLSVQQDGSSKLDVPHGSDDQPSKPADMDVCFGDKRHPGTRKFRQTVQNMVKRDPRASYGPEVYREIMKKTKGTNFYVSKGQGKYTKPSKLGLRDWVGETYKEVKREFHKESSCSEVMKRSRSSKDMRRSSSSKDLHRSSSSSKDIRRSSSSKDLHRSSSCKDIRRSSSSRDLHRSVSSRDLDRSGNSRDNRRSRSSRDLSRSSSHRSLRDDDRGSRKSRSSGSNRQRSSDSRSRTSVTSSESTIDTNERSRSSQNRSKRRNSLKRRNSSRRSLSSID